MAQYKRKRFDSTGDGTYPSSPRLKPTGEIKKNTVATGPGSQRKGQKYRVKYDFDKGDIYHVYGRGKKAKRVHLRDKTARKYGYPDTGL